MRVSCSRRSEERASSSVSGAGFGLESAGGLFRNEDEPVAVASDGAGGAEVLWCLFRRAAGVVVDADVAGVGDGFGSKVTVVCGRGAVVVDFDAVLVGLCPETSSSSITSSLVLPSGVSRRSSDEPAFSSSSSSQASLPDEDRISSSD